MKHYAIYDLLTGAVRCFMSSTPDHIDGSTPDGFGWIEIDSFPDGGWRVDLGTLTLVSGAIDTRSLSQMKEDAWEAIKDSRSAAIYGTFTWDGSEFDCNANSQALIQGAVLDALVASQSGSAFSIAWTLADNSVRALSASQVIQVGLAMSTHIQSNFGKGQALRTSINAATSADQLEAIKWA